MGRLLNQGRLYSSVLTVGMVGCQQLEAAVNIHWGQVGYA